MGSQTQSHISPLSELTDLSAWPRHFLPLLPTPKELGKQLNCSLQNNTLEPKWNTTCWYLFCSFLICSWINFTLLFYSVLFLDILYFTVLHCTVFLSASLAYRVPGKVDIVIKIPMVLFMHMIHMLCICCIVFFYSTLWTQNTVYRVKWIVCNHP